MDKVTLSRDEYVTYKIAVNALLSYLRDGYLLEKMHEEREKTIIYLRHSTNRNRIKIRKCGVQLDIFSNGVLVKSV